jgi:PTS system nitrogen regulatory IIA component
LARWALKAFDLAMTALFTLLPQAVETVKLDSKVAVLERLATIFASVYGLDRAAVLARLQAREDLGSTGFGRGVAIPHARMADVEHPMAVFLRLESPVAFEAADDMPVDLVFGLLSPEHAGVVHLHALAAISRMLRDEKMHNALSDAPSDEAIYSLIANVVDRGAT